jgi:hypothetical protein
MQQHTVSQPNSMLGTTVTACADVQQHGRALRHMLLFSL